MTLVRVDLRKLRRFEVTGARGHIEMHPTEREHVVTETENFITLPTPVSVQLVDGVAVLDAPEGRVRWAERVPGDLDRTTMVPAPIYGTGGAEVPWDYGDLEDV